MLDTRLDRLIQTGSLDVSWPNGRTSRFGQSKASEPDVAVRLTGYITPLKLGLHPDLFLGEAYVDGTLSLERGSLSDLMTLLCQNMTIHRDGALRGLARTLFNWAVQHNSRRSSQRNAAHHYDLSIQMYRLFLDQDLQYSCAYFPRPDFDLEAAQLAKKQHLALKLQLQPNQRILDIGCGWGGLALFLAQMQDVEVLGITLSREQLDVARSRAAQAGLTGRVRFELLDFRDVPRTI